MSKIIDSILGFILGIVVLGIIGIILFFAMTMLGAVLVLVAIVGLLVICGILGLLFLEWLKDNTFIGRWFKK